MTVLTLDGCAPSGGPVTAGLLLAAGAASRMGHRPKCLLQLGGVPLIRRLLIALAEAGVHDRVLVLGHYADRIEAAVSDLPVRRVRNPEPDAGQASSLRLGLQALQQPLDSVLVALADQPLVDAQDIRDLITAYRGRPAGTEMVQPVVDGLPGNPVLFSQRVLQQILAGDADMGGRQWQTAHPQALHRWVTPNPHYRVDLDSPEDLARFTANTGQPLHWPADLQASG